MSEKKIDAHVQFNGTNFQLYRERQPNLKCETPDHLTCKLASERLQAEEDAKSAEQKAQEIAAAKAAVDAAAASRVVDEQKARTDRAGQAKHEAQRQAGIQKVLLIESAQNEAALAIRAAQEIADKVRLAEEAKLEVKVGEIIQAHIDRTREIEATDWLAKTAEAQDPAVKEPPAAPDSADAAGDSPAKADAPDSDSRTIGKAGVESGDHASDEKGE